MKAQLEDLKKFIKEQEILTRRTILKNAKKNDYNHIKKQLNEFIQKEKNERLEAIEKELNIISMYHDQIEMLKTYF